MDSRLSIYGPNKDLSICEGNKDDPYGANKNHESESKILASSAKGCLLATSIFSNSFELQVLVWKELHKKIDLTSLTRDMTIVKRSFAGKIIAKLHLDFFDNRIVTYFENEKKSVKLSVALGIINDLSVIFEKLLAAHEFINVLEDKNNVSTLNFSVGEKELVRVSFDTERVFFITDWGQSSIPFETIQNCLHLFNSDFANAICEEMGILAKDGLHVAINKIYLGRCILGLQKSIIIQRFNQSSHVRELQRIVNLIKNSRSEFHSVPLT